MDTQLGFDFFNAAPEKEKPVVVKEVSKVQEVSKIQEVSQISHVSQVQEVQEVLKIEEVLENEGVSTVQEVEEFLEVQEADVEIIVDDEVRELEFFIAKPVTKTYNIKEKKSTRGRMKLSDMDLMVHLVEVPEDEILFQKSYYGISEVSNMFKVNISLIRFWEIEFDILKPKKNGKGDRLFRPEDIKNLQLIYHLLREKKYTIDGAKDFLKKNRKAEETFELIDSLKKTKIFLLDLKANL